MNLSDNMKARILEAIRQKDLSKTELAEAMGLGNSWVTKLFKARDAGGLKTLTDEQIEKLETFLGITFQVRISEKVKISGTIAELAKRADADRELHQLLESLKVMTDDHRFTPRFFETKEMNPLGAQIRKIVSECAIGSGGKYKDGKIAREVLKLVSAPSKCKE